MGTHLIDGEFQSDKYPSTPRGKVPLSTKDPMAQDLLWIYADRHRAKDAEFSDDLQVALRMRGFNPVRASVAERILLVAMVLLTVLFILSWFEIFLSAGQLALAVGVVGVWVFVSYRWWKL